MRAGGLRRSPSRIETDSAVRRARIFAQSAAATSRRDRTARRKSSELGQIPGPARRASSTESGSPGSASGTRRSLRSRRTVASSRSTLRCHVRSGYRSPSAGREVVPVGSRWLPLRRSSRSRRSVGLGVRVRIRSSPRHAQPVAEEDDDDSGESRRASREPRARGPHLVVGPAILEPLPGRRRSRS
jgi:hypothetical protein